ncbi:unnamed protein product [Gadus morhua 'NCC']
MAADAMRGLGRRVKLSLKVNASLKGDISPLPAPGAALRVIGRQVETRAMSQLKKREVCSHPASPYVFLKMKPHASIVR